MKNSVRLVSIVSTVLVLVFSGKNVFANGRKNSFEVTAAQHSCIDRTCAQSSVDFLLNWLPLRSDPCKEAFIREVQKTGKNPCTEMCLQCNITCHQLSGPNNHNGQIMAGHCLPLTDYNLCFQVQHYCKALDEAADCIINPTNECIQNVEGGHYTACLACNSSCHLLNQPILAANCEREYANEEGSAAYCKRKWNEAVALVKCTECSRTCNRLLPNNDYGQLLGRDCLRKSEASICDDMKAACEAIHESTDCIANPTVSCIRNVPENRYFICLVCALRCNQMNDDNLADLCGFHYSSPRGQLEQCRSQWIQCEIQSDRLHGRGEIR